METAVDTPITKLQNFHCGVSSGYARPRGVSGPTVPTRYAVGNKCLPNCGVYLFVDAFCLCGDTERVIDVCLDLLFAIFSQVRHVLRRFQHVPIWNASSSDERASMEVFASDDQCSVAHGPRAAVHPRSQAHPPGGPVDHLECCLPIVMV